ncbi:endonuclease/exonuclease/phosphatase family protein [Isoptericola sp. NPDC057653]|uniref:endonuclease/exonuclease/phosphatase family protein n=1 Tax=Isoptericola sp. NPDC057653 TaxID=3346195 RepID=UPI0036A2C5A6
MPDALPTADRPADRSPAPSDVPLIGAPEADLLHVMSLNVRCAIDDTVPGTPDHWPDRAPLVTALLARERPTLLGVQEAHFAQLVTVTGALGDDYRSVGHGREGGAAGEHSAIVYDARRLTLLWWDQYWLSDTPRLAGSTWDHQCPRVVTWARFRDERTGRELLHVNSHLDHESGDARERGARVVRAEIEAAGLPAVFTADTNAPAGRSAPYDVLVTEGGLLDTWLDAADRHGPEVGTFPDYGAPQPGGERIDWILTTPDSEVHAAAINTWTRDGRWPSDHTPVQALLRLA